MWELFELVFGGLVELTKFLFGWRFYVCLIGAAGVVMLIHSAIENEKLSLALSVPLVLAALVTGVVWQSHHGW